MNRTWTALTWSFLVVASASCKLGDCSGSANRPSDSGTSSQDDPAAPTEHAAAASNSSAPTLAPPTGPIDCSRASGYCPNDDPPTASVHDRCLQSLGHPKCGAAFRTFQECMRDSSKCDAAGRSNLSAATASCRHQLEAFSACQSLNEERPRSRPM